MITIEIAANNYTSAKAAYEGGASRIELVSNLAEGGTTPSLGTFKQCQKDLPIDCFPIIRARGGNFVYTNQEIQSMITDIEIFAKHGCKGIVIGALLENNDIDLKACKQMMTAAGDMQVTFHRAFDRSADAEKAIQQIIDLGCKRILTSGQKADAYEGRMNIAAWNTKYGNQIIFLPGAGITKENSLAIVEATGCKEIHTSAKSTSKGYIESDAKIIQEFVENLK
jgi:copper homeostasis protein